MTIGQLASLAGTTVRAVRHYHAEGVLAEPERDHSGYRRYGASALVRLMRVRRLRELGIPLARVRELLDDGAPLAVTLDELDAELAAKQDAIAAQRRRLAELRQGRLDPELPAAFAEMFSELAAHGVPAEVLASEKEAVLITLAIDPDQWERLAVEYRRMLSGPTVAVGAGLMVRIAALATADPADPAVDELAVDVAEFLREHSLDLIRATQGSVGAGRAGELLFAEWNEGTAPAQRRMFSLAAARVAAMLEEQAESVDGATGGVGSAG
ncbi:MerR family transcriptional regulator [Goodfellowiella coeruleoviolacea]|uniref:MerR family transcriptional regulator n=1 Tax=Goodfellowiella coeruleoviolacea TaxID=334858 RepID=UPI0020A3E370|nr:MerR family transcriptional regulator [Goodfellowiella coeruleoviolacea]